MSLNPILARLTAIEGIRAVVIAGREGLVIAHTEQPLPDAEALAAYGASALSAADRFCRGTVGSLTGCIRF